jgi:hypothetical protein
MDKAFLENRQMQKRVTTSTLIDLSHLSQIQGPSLTIAGRLSMQTDGQLSLILARRPDGQAAIHGAYLL